MDTIRLLQTLESFPQQDIVQYYVVHAFLEDPTYTTFMALLPEFDRDMGANPALNDEQAACMKYLLRDWAFQYLKPSIKRPQIEAMFKDGEEQHASGHFMDAIDFAKRNPKDNQLLMRFGLMLLIHHPKPGQDVSAKIDALEQLLTHQDMNLISFTPPHPAKQLRHMILYSGLLGFYCLWLLATLEYPQL